MSTPTPTGRRHDSDGETYCVWQREFNAPIDDVWAAVTEPERLARWIGTWTGDPADGHVRFQMLFEGDDATGEMFTIDECEPPHRLRITTSMPNDGENPEHWLLRLDLEETDGVTTLTFAQNVPDLKLAQGVGPGWDYYLDRMVAAESGGSVESIVFDDYSSSMTEYYRNEFAGLD
ncbi:SRPBCC family protein [Gordonia sp. TBRC 11910]|uniref:SRPBCC family protein n=1 Tax=Gordonia asplenii TaxID=2725283 RepID=A0A848KVJ0_9ACTN|nr:SRPBCC family protein [Gordonia asplenii]NMO02686.1 SRPBCC family protein [Gordonia asplenii]